jgi:hypothetical protein
MLFFCNVAHSSLLGNPSMKLTDPDVWALKQIDTINNDLSVKIFAVYVFVFQLRLITVLFELLLETCPAKGYFN